MWWDLSDLSCSELEEEYFGDSADLNVSFSSSLYKLIHDPEYSDNEDDLNDEDDEDETINEDDVNNEVVDKDKAENIFITNLISTISEIAPKSLYKRRKNSMKRKRNRRKRKRRIAEKIDKEMSSIYKNVGDLFAHSAVSVKTPPSSLPTINLNIVNRTMLRKLPEVVEVPIMSCSVQPEFYTKVIGNAVTRTTSIPFTEFDRPGGNCFGKLPAILTDLGPVPPPKDSYYGYVYADGGWRVKAESPRVPNPGGQHGRGDDGGGQVGGAERRGEWKRRNLCGR